MLTLLVAAPALGQSTERVSVHSDGTQGNFGSDSAPYVSPDGRWVTFSSLASSLVDGDTNGVPTFLQGRDAFVRDRLTDITERASVNSDEEERNGISLGPVSASADGRYVVFGSDATNLVPNDTNGLWDVFLRDRVLGTTQRVSVNGLGEEAFGFGTGSRSAVISGDGRFVAFTSDADNLALPCDEDPLTELLTCGTGGVDIFVRDLVSGTTRVASVDSVGSALPITSVFNRPAINADGRFVAFNSGFRVFVHDLLAGVTERVDVDSQGNPGAGRGFFGYSLSADGRFVAFPSEAANLVPLDTNGWIDLFVHDRLTGVTERVNVDSAGAQADSGATASAFSPDGRFVGFTSRASNLVPGDTNGFDDVFVHDRLTGVTERLSVSSAGAEGDSHSQALSDTWLSADGRFGVFGSVATNLVAGDTNLNRDTFIRDRLGTATVAGMDVVAQPPAVDDLGAEAGGPVTLIFDEVTSAGDTTVTVTESGPAPPPGFSLGDPPVYFDVETTASFAGNVEVCISYAGFTFSVDESELRLYHDDGGGFVDVTSSQDTAFDVICGIVTSLSPFAVLQPSGGGGDPQQLLAELGDAISTLGLKQGLGKSLDAKLAAVARAMDDVQLDDDAAAVGALQALVAELEAQSGKAIASGDAEALIASTNAVIALLEEGA